MEEEEEVDTEKLTPSSVVAKMQTSELINKEEQDEKGQSKATKERVTLVREVKGDQVRSKLPDEEKKIVLENLDTAYKSFSNISIGTVLEAKDLFGNWKPGIVVEKHIKKTPPEIMVSVDRLVSSYMEDGDGLQNLAPLGTNIKNIEKGVVAKLQQELLQKTQKKDKKKKAGDSKKDTLGKGGDRGSELAGRSK